MAEGEGDGRRWAAEGVDRELVSGTPERRFMAGWDIPQVVGRRQ